MNIVSNRIKPPKPTQDLEKAKRDLDEFGICLIDRALDTEQLTRLRNRLYAAADDDVRLKRPSSSSGGDHDSNNQRIWGLLNRGQEFVNLVEDPRSIELLKYLLEWPFLLSSISANIAGPGHDGMVIHADQLFVPEPWPARPQGANCFWLVDDFTADNGATHVAVGSHRLNRMPKDDAEAESYFVPLEAPAGTMCVMEGRIWHRTGCNVTANERRAGIFAWNVRKIYRTQENWFLSLNPLVRQSASEDLLWMLGYRLDTFFGHVNGYDPI